MPFNIADLEDEQIVTLDFETYFDKDYSLSKISTLEYILDSNFLIHGVGIKIGLGCSTWYSRHAVLLAEVLHEFDWSQLALLCQHTPFDGKILSHHFRINPMFMLDTRAMGRCILPHSESVSLKNLNIWCGTGTKDQTALFDVMGKRELTDEEDRKLGNYCCDDTDQTRAVFDHLYPSVPDSELDLIDITTKLYTDPVVMVDVPRLERIIKHYNLEKIKAVFLTGEEPTSLSSRIKFAGLLTNLGVNPPEKPSPTNPDRSTYAFCKTDPDFISLLNHPDKRVRNLVDARLRVTSRILETRSKRLLAATNNGTRPLSVPLTFCGAHTMRWTGWDKINPQNYTRGSELRKAIEAPKGSLLMAGDSSQIEARMNAWLCGDRELLDIFTAYDAGTGPDVYRVMAAKIYSAPIDKITSKQRHVGKAAVLGLGYGMGSVRFRGMLSTQSIAVDSEFAWRTVSIYRETRAAIVEFWKVCDHMLQGMSTKGFVEHIGPLVVGFQHIMMPNGLTLQYPDLECSDDGDWTYTNRYKKPTKIYGAMLLENIIQCLARIVVADQMRIMSKLHRVVWMTHDEFVNVVPDDGKTAAREAKMMQVMRTAPDWCKDLPLNAEIETARHYAK